MTETTLKEGHIVGIAGPVIDVDSPPTPCPTSTTHSSSRSRSKVAPTVITAEVAQQIGDSRIRAIAMKPTDGLTAARDVRNLGRGIHVPVGDATLGHVFNVIGEPLDVASVDGTPTGRSTARPRCSPISRPSGSCSRRASRSSTC